MLFRSVATVESIATVGIGPVLFVTLIPVPADTAVISPVSFAIHSRPVAVAELTDKI